ncbi:iron chelate uptake ABC transporter family permease subunit [Gymnodinialimonas ceratoperidinii]|uniref:Iron chelate uptake ABC transporter family permease subunit n=1 Tax=Gymnodinialimonas ceratoperidinii TaxID=2856823 RepID=A0A8F6YAE4_9RHOB|nr:iron chelate uptake ABC transporter family permease subunit [Gymnodinialimonas ceratoperidinii]QXT39488.1 iron chelate uptake ABC transporter family permease subunit [Gymnodinialimonas ceratoperidinii]
MVKTRLIPLALLLAALCALFLLWNLRAPVSFILSLRFEKLAALLLVGAATGVATLLFQTVAQTRLLTPGIVGFDALFVFLQTTLVFTLGGIGYVTLPPFAAFLAEAAILIVAAVALFGIVLRKGASDLVRVVLTGVIFGILLRGLASFMQRILDPSEFAIVQQASFASFASVEADQLGVAALILGACVVLAMALASRLDVAALGRDTARSLGLHYDRFVLAVLALVAALVAVSTALVGPITFLGLLAASLAHALLPTHRHALLIPASGLIGAIILVAGQFIFERVLAMSSTLAVLIEFLGGLLFLMLILRRRTT